MPKNINNANVSKKNIWILVFLSYFLGILGAHRFYVGRWKTGLLMFFTMGGFFIWWIVDFLIICFRGFSDAEGNLIIPPRLKTPRHKEISWWLLMGFFTIPLIYLGGNWILFGCPVVVILGLLGWNASKCPHCKQAFSTEEINRILVNSYQSTETVNQLLGDLSFHLQLIILNSYENSHESRRSAPGNCNGLRRSAVRLPCWRIRCRPGF